MTAGVSAGKKFRPTSALVNLGNLRANFRTLRNLAPSKDGFQCPMVKANAYGHGDIAVAGALRLEGARHLGVALIEEGVRLRQAGDKGEILVFGIFSTADEVRQMRESQLTTVAGEWSQLEVLAKERDVKTKIHVEFNTGMNRLGFSTSEAPRLRAWLEKNPNIEVEGICTHLLRSEDSGLRNGDSEKQFADFSLALKEFRGLHFTIHALNSGGTAASAVRSLKFENGPLGARPGIALYGVQPGDEKELELRLKPVLSWKSSLISVHKIDVGETVSYNATWRAQRESLIGVVPVGYADGYSRALSNRGSVLCRGKKVPVVGTVCMDYFMIDLTDTVTSSFDGVQPGEEVVLLGEQGAERISALEMAKSRGTIAYEVLTNISERVPRTYVESESK